MDNDHSANAQRPDEDNILRLPRARSLSRPAPEEVLDLSNEEPSPRAVVRPDTSTLHIEFDVLRLIRGRFSLNVQGTLSWASPFCAVVLLFAIGGFVAAGLIQPTGTPALLRLVVATTAGGTMLGAGVGAFIYCLHCLRGHIAR
jgi:hypothetical protein